MDLRGKSYSDRYGIVARLISQGYIVHGGESEFNEFDSKYIRGGNRGEYGYGFYFCNEAYKPINYGDYIYAVKLDRFRLCNLNSVEGNPLDDIDRIRIEAENGMDSARNNREYDYYSKLSESMELNREERDYLMFFERGIRECGNCRDAYKYALNYIPGNYNPINLSSLFMKVGYDGIIAENQYIIFNIEKLNNNLEEVSLEEGYDVLGKIIGECINRYINGVIDEGINIGGVNLEKGMNVNVDNEDWIGMMFNPESPKVIETRDFNISTYNAWKRLSINHPQIGIVRTVSHPTVSNPTSLLVGYATLVDIKKYDDIESFNNDYEGHKVSNNSKYAFKDGIGKFGIILSDIHKIDEPIKLRGAGPNTIRSLKV